jgi:hypothetical protein
MAPIIDRKIGLEPDDGGSLLLLVTNFSVVIAIHFGKVIIFFFLKTRWLSERKHYTPGRGRYLWRTLLLLDQTFLFRPEAEEMFIFWIASQKLEEVLILGVLSEKGGEL